MSPYKKIRTKNKMALRELSERMQLPLKLVKAYEREGVDPSLHYHANFKAIFNVSDEDINRVKTTGGI
ncbi:transcriptional regulator, Cro/CI family [Enterococcus faecalis LA3B-2]|nr:transcriptional regulator, Cro/CI family [Enterococcus faecalis]EPI36818.1 transcriptional regulator, Cro/CI family [Enterococcus faecalis LA3B-2]